MGKKKGWGQLLDKRCACEGGCEGQQRQKLFRIEGQQANVREVFHSFGIVIMRSGIKILLLVRCQGEDCGRFGCYEEGGCVLAVFTAPQLSKL